MCFWPCLQVAELTKTWAGKWKDMQQIIEVSGEREEGRGRGVGSFRVVVRKDTSLMPLPVVAVWYRRENWHCTARE